MLGSIRTSACGRSWSAWPRRSSEVAVLLGELPSRVFFSECSAHKSRGTPRHGGRMQPRSYFYHYFSSWCRLDSKGLRRRVPRVSRMVDDIRIAPAHLVRTLLIDRRITEPPHRLRR